jgi:hypothetical protein
MSFGGTLMQPQADIWVEVIQWRRTRRSLYHPVGINVKADICEATAGSDSVFKTILAVFVPDFLEKMNHLIRRCPYLPDRLELLNLTVPNSIYTTSFFLRGNLKLSIRFFNGKNQTLYEVVFYALVN